MKRFFCLGLFLGIIYLSAWALRFDFSYYPNTAVQVLLKKGTSADTLYTGILDKEGKINFNPTEGNNSPGMATVNVGKASFDFIINGEDVLIRCPEEHIHGGNVIFEDSPENESLQKWFYEYSLRKQNIDLLIHLEQFYEKGNTFLTSLTNEKERLLRIESDFQSMLKKSPLYSARFMQFYIFTSNDIAGLPYADLVEMAKIRKYVREELDINGLFTSGLWFNTLNGLLSLYNTDTPFHNDFMGDIYLLLKRADSEKVYTTLSENLFAICETTGWNKHEEQLAYYLINDGRIKEPTGKLKLLMTVYKLNTGSKAPALSQGRLYEDKTLLVFYETGCGNCENEMQQLSSAYPLIRNKGYRIVSVSADMNEQIFKNTASGFPWKERYCDLKGFEGEDFVNYGIIGTPTFYLIDDNGFVKGRYSRLTDTGLIP